MLIWRGHKAKVRSLAFSPDGRFIATTAGTSMFVWLWEASTGKLVRKLMCSYYRLRAVAFFPDGRHIAAVQDRGGACVWETETGAVVAQFTATTSLYPDTIAVSPDGTRLFAVVSVGSVVEWDEPTRPGPSVLRPLDRTHSKLARGTPRLGFSPLGKYFCIAEWQMHLLEPNTLEPRRTLRTPAGNASAAAFAFAPDESQMVVAFGHRAAVWRLDEPDAPPVRCSSHGNLVRAVGVLPGGTVFSAAMDGTVRLFDSTTGAETRSFDWGIGPVQAAAVSPDGTLCAAGGDDGHLVVWDVDV
jgi:WD40 repeat protein